jgi:hypothetical protein
MTSFELLILLKLHNRELTYVEVTSDDVKTHEALTSLAEKKFIDAYDLEFPVTKLGEDRIYKALSEGINYDRHFKEVSITAKRAAFLALINSGYEPRGLVNFLLHKLSPITYNQFKKHFQRGNIRRLAK